MKRVLVLVGLLFALPAWSATYYVDCAASGDSGAGTSTATAWKTVGKINGSSFSPGDSILFKRNCTWRESLDPHSSGASGNPITFGAYGTGANPVISGADLVTGWALYSGSVWQAALTTNPNSELFINSTFGDHKTSIGALVNEYDWYWASNVLYLYALSDPDTRYTNPGVEARVRQRGVTLNNSYLVYDGLTVEKFWGANFQSYGGNGHSIVRNCVGQYGGDGILLGANTLITGYEIYGNIFRWNNERGVGGELNVTNVKVHNNEVYENGTLLTGDQYTADIKFWDNATGVEGIEIYENYIHGSNVGIWVDGVQPPTKPNLIHHNWIEDDAEVGVLLEITSSTHVWANVIWNCGTETPSGQAWNYAGISISSRLIWPGSNNLIYNNTIYGAQVGINVWLDSYQLTTARLNNNIIKNNIVVNSITRALSVGRGGDNKTYGSGNIYEFNCFGPESSNFIEWGVNTYKSTYGAWEAAYGGPTHSVQADPQLANPPAGDFTLRATSPCIDAGTDLGPSYSTALLPTSSWPSHVLTGDQYRNGQRWEVGACLFPAPAPPPGSSTPTPTPTPGGPPTMTPTPTPAPTPTLTPRPVTFGAFFTFSPSLPTHGQEVQFTDSSIGASGWNWAFGDGTQSSLRNPTHIYLARGVYTAVLWVSNGVNWSKAEKTVTVTGSGRIRRNLAAENVRPPRPPGD